MNQNLTAIFKNFLKTGLKNGLKNILKKPKLLWILLLIFIPLLLIFVILIPIFIFLGVIFAILYHIQNLFFKKDKNPRNVQQNIKNRQIGEKNIDAVDVVFHKK